MERRIVKDKIKFNKMEVIARFELAINELQSFALPDLAK